MQSAKAAAKGPVKKKRAKKDKNAPKGAMSAFMQFSQKERPAVSRRDKKRLRILLCTVPKCSGACGGSVSVVLDLFLS